VEVEESCGSRTQSISQLTSCVPSAPPSNSLFRDQGHDVSTTRELDCECHLLLVECLWFILLPSYARLEYPNQDWSFLGEFSEPEQNQDRLIMYEISWIPGTSFLLNKWHECRRPIKSSDVQTWLWNHMKYLCFSAGCIHIPVCILVDHLISQLGLR
jgi:hypothetical protein